MRATSSGHGLWRIGRHRKPGVRGSKAVFLFQFREKIPALIQKQTDFLTR
jgi:hypothetical protein